MAGPRPRLIVVVAFGAAESLAATLGPLGAEDVVVVDNSADADVRGVATTAGARYVDTGANLGFAAGVNVALRAERATSFPRDVLLLNPDAVLTPAALDLLQEAFADAGVGAAAPTLTAADGGLQRVSWPFPSPGGMWREALGLPARGTGRSFLVGAALLLRREALAAVGLLDERYFLYAEEADWQRRALDLGWRSVAVAGAQARHEGGGTSTDAHRQQQLFHAGQETYVRRWFGPVGWASYRVAATLGAGARAAVLPAPRRGEAARRAALYARGPRSVSPLPERPRPLRIAHVVVTDNAAGTERYVRDVAAEQAALGHDVVVIGGAASFMVAGLPAGVQHLPGRTLPEALRSLWAVGSRDVVHTHLTAADAVGVAAKPRHGGAVVSTRHIAAPRGSSVAARLGAAVVERGIDLEVCISDVVRAATGRPGVVLRNGVRDDGRSPDPAARQFLVAQRLEREKDTGVAVRAWAASGLAADGWCLVVCGDGAERAALEALGVAGIEWRGWVADVKAEMLRSAALIATAPAEPLGLTVLEAMSVALPVIAADGGGHRETLAGAPGRPWFVPADPRSLADALRALAASDPAARASRGRELRRIQQERWSLGDHVVRLTRLYAAARAPKSASSRAAVDVLG